MSLAFTNYFHVASLLSLLPLTFLIPLLQCSHYFCDATQQPPRKRKYALHRLTRTTLRFRQNHAALQRNRNISQPVICISSWAARNTPTRSTHYRYTLLGTYLTALPPTNSKLRILCTSDSTSLQSNNMRFNDYIGLRSILHGTYTFYRYLRKTRNTRVRSNRPKSQHKAHTTHCITKPNSKAT